jgi:hypothetical protein
MSDEAKKWGIWMKDNTGGVFRECWTLLGESHEVYDNKAEAEEWVRKYNTFFDGTSYEVREYTPAARGGSSE